MLIFKKKYLCSCLFKVLNYAVQLALISDRKKSSLSEFDQRKCMKQICRFFWGFFCFTCSCQKMHFEQLRAAVSTFSKDQNSMKALQVQILKMILHIQPLKSHVEKRAAAHLEAVVLAEDAAVHRFDDDLVLHA